MLVVVELRQVMKHLLVIGAETSVVRVFLGCLELGGWHLVRTVK